MLWVHRGFCDLIDVTLADGDANSILANDANRAIPSNMTMQVAPPGCLFAWACRSLFLYMLIYRRVC